MARDTLLFRRDEARRAGWLVVQSQVHRDLREALETLVPGAHVVRERMPGLVSAFVAAVAAEQGLDRPR